MRVCITVRPRERVIDGMSFHTLQLGRVCDGSAAIGTWLIVQGNAYPEMRRPPEEGDIPGRPVKRDRRRKRR